MLSFAGISFLGMFLVGLLLLSGFGPMIALSFAQFPQWARRSYPRRSVSSAQQGSPQPASLSILIPVFRDPNGLARTLRSIEQAQRFPEALGFASIELHIGIDGECGECERVAEGYTANIFHSHQNHGKWLTLKRLLERSGRSQWVAFVDAGVEWSEDLLVKCAQSFHRQDIIGIAPTYRIRNCGRMSKLFWWIECLIKCAENFFGGPISVHGATVFYRRRQLENVIQELGSLSWINDDVVIPLMMRTMYPHRKIVYKASMSVHDTVEEGESNRRGDRRLRLALGNCQWIKWLYPRIWRENRSVAILALRRIARLVWAWWLLFLLIAMLLFASERTVYPSPYPILLIVALSLLFILSLRPFVPLLTSIKAMSAAVEGSLKSPLYLITLKERRRILWN